jgi:hypothetical protein
MTPADHRAKCIEASAEAIYDDECGPGAWKELIASAIAQNLTRPTHFEKKYLMRGTAVLDSLHGIARVVPVKPTEEMNLAAMARDTDDFSLRLAIDAANARGDITKPPEGKQ